MRPVNKIHSRLQVMMIIGSEADTIKKANDRMRYWKKILKQIDQKEVRLPAQIELPMRGDS